MIERTGGHIQIDCGSDQKNFDGRIVVLRKSDQSNNLLQYHSDIRSDKIQI